MRVKTGDLAIIMHARFGCNVGKIVQVQSFFGGDDDCWYISNGNHIKTEVGNLFVAICPDKSLQKISGPEAFDSIVKKAAKTKEKIVENN